MLAEDFKEFPTALGAIYARFRPNKVVAPATPTQAMSMAPKLPLLANRQSLEGRTTTYLCEKFACRAPVVGVEALESALDSVVGPG